MSLNNKGFVHLIPIFLIALFVVGALGSYLLFKGFLDHPLLSKKEIAVELRSQYKNPFDKKTQYVNPFDQTKNPLVIAK